MLSPREVQVCARLVTGHSADATALELGLSLGGDDHDILAAESTVSPRRRRASSVAPRPSAVVLLDDID